MKQKTLYLVCATVLLAGIVTDEAHARPGWVVSMGRELDFPADEYLTGFGVSPDDKGMSMAEKLTYARNMAYRNLASALQVEITLGKIY